MAKGRPATAEGYILEELYKTQGELEAAKEELSATRKEFEDIREVFKVELATTKNEFKLVRYYEPGNYWRTDCVCFSGSLVPEEFNPEFARLIKVLRLPIPVVKDEDLKDDTAKNEVEKPAED